jgi:ABC-type nitrate/sulfonate/bicarbonate transport system ATPase subunit
MEPSLNGMGNGTASVKDSLVLDKVEKRYGDFVALEPTDLTIKAGEFITLLGPSGSGKTTILMSIAGFVAPSSGRMLLDGRDVTGLPPERRNFGVVFQGYALFPHLTVYDNVAFPLRARGITGDAARPKIMAALEMAKLGAFAHRYPRQLSGGQQQRVALARSLVFSPELLLLDEPLSALDKALRKEFQTEFRSIHREVGSTFIYVTHDHPRSRPHPADRPAGRTLRATGHRVRRGLPRQEQFPARQGRLGQRRTGRDPHAGLRRDGSRERHRGTSRTGGRRRTPPGEDQAGGPSCCG